MEGLPMYAKVISVRNPWGPFMLYPPIFTSRGLRPKRVENRDTDLSKGHRGPVFFHAGKEPDPGFYNKREGRFVHNRTLPQRMADLLPHGYPEWASTLCGEHMGVGGIIGVGRLVDVVQRSKDPWFVGPYGLVFEDLQPLPFFEARGYPWMWEIETAPILELLKTHCCCCGEICGQQNEGTVWCSCSLKPCLDCGKCEEHCLCDLLFPDMSEPDKARMAILEHIFRKQVLS